MKSRTPTQDECRLILRAARKEQDPKSACAMVILLWRAGLRSIEVQRACFEHIEKRNGGFALHVPLGKGNKRRTIGLTAKDFSYLRHGKSGLILETKAGKPWDTRRMRRVLARLVARANLLIPFSPHDFRHAFAQELLSESRQIQFVQRQLGHADLQTTQIYLASMGDQQSVEFCMGREW